MKSYHTSQAIKLLNKIQLDGKHDFANDFLKDDVKILKWVENTAGSLIGMGELADNNAITNMAQAIQKDNANKKIFLEAMQAQSKSLGTTKNSNFKKLFKLVEPLLKKDNPDNSDFNSIRTFATNFLRARNDVNLPSNAFETVEDLEQIADASKTKGSSSKNVFRRNKFKSINEKLQSSRESNLIKIFMVLVLYHYSAISISDGKEGDYEISEDEKTITFLNKNNNLKMDAFKRFRKKHPNKSSKIETVHIKGRIDSINGSYWRTLYKLKKTENLVFPNMKEIIIDKVFSIKRDSQIHGIEKIYIKDVDQICGHAFRNVGRSDSIKIDHAGYVCFGAFDLVQGTIEIGCIDTIEPSAFTNCKVKEGSEIGTIKKLNRGKDKQSGIEAIGIPAEKVKEFQDK